MFAKAAIVQRFVESVMPALARDFRKSDTPTLTVDDLTPKPSQHGPWCAGGCYCVSVDDETVEVPIGVVLGRAAPA